MERIVLEVNDNTAKSWRNTTPKLKQRIEKHLSKEIEIILEASKSANFELLLSEARNEAESKGLTEEILQKLLNEES